MRYSKLFGKSIRQVSSDIGSKGNELLYRGGFIRESSSGRFYMLPLGMRVQERICRIIAGEMDKLDAQRISVPTLHPFELWEETKRTESVSFELMSVTDRNKRKFVLGGTAEEMMVDLVRKFEISIKDLPFCIYQFSQKFRDELRARGGLLRCKEFLMKDAYSFHATREDFEAYYQRMKEGYQSIFRRLGLKTIVVEADNGYMGGEYCHEIVVEHEVGESHFLSEEGAETGIHEELMQSRSRADKAQFKDAVKRRGIEVGNIFQLGTWYSERMRDAQFTGEDGQKRPYYMGCYGLGVGRTLAAIAEVHNDERGLLWPDNAAPYDIHLVSLGGSDNETQAADRLYERLVQNGTEVLYDDRTVSAGVKFADADLIGIPHRYVVSSRTLANGAAMVEYKHRGKAESELISFDKAAAGLR